MSEQVDVEKMVEGVGFRFFPDDIGGLGGHGSDQYVREKRGWKYPNDYRYHDSLPDFDRDLNACFKHLEPPLYERFGIYHIGFARVKGVGYNCYMNRAAIEYPHREEGRSKELMTLGHGKTLGESFLNAAWRVINRYPELEKGIIEQLVDAESNI